METIRIRRAGYPIRHVFTEFIDRYRVLVSGMKSHEHHPDVIEACRKLATKVIGKDADWQIGRTKVFLKVQGHPSLFIDLLIFLFSGSRRSTFGGNARQDSHETRSNHSKSRSRLFPTKAIFENAHSRRRIAKIHAKSAPASSLSQSKNKKRSRDRFIIFLCR